MDLKIVDTIKKGLQEVEKYDTIVINTSREYKEYLKEAFPAFIVNPGRQFEQSTEVYVTESDCKVVNYSLFIYGVYIKKCRNVSQTPMPNVNNAVSDIFHDFVQFYAADSFNFVAAGREDVDVINVSGRPFFVELKNPRQHLFVPIPVVYWENDFVLLKNLLRVKGKPIKKIILDGEREHKKRYSAIVFCSKPSDPTNLFNFEGEGDHDTDAENLLHSSDLEQLVNKKLLVMQKTPLRVLHRRANMNRPKEIEITKIKKYQQYLRVTILSSAGAYIKEFITGDFGRTTPSLASLLGCWCDCVELNVLEVEAKDVPEDCIYEVM
ncbi:TIGR01213 family protein [Vavraia culicis subsp. floridensis]|uniref:tRNA pseudouridine(55) synthase n=1 Tax=Vavraia culicis (isolate floridensis) TaxID=948595 RepID=L2GVT7_VAVCU|nr:TIGR01213 family protein [Vavraia culicis subsp. floridensis]ELA47457.1 TIGR01213 family protein [Vavraia culicis subsp. floridensis]